MEHKNGDIMTLKEEIQSLLIAHFWRDREIDKLDWELFDKIIPKIIKKVRKLDVYKEKGQKA